MLSAVRAYLVERPLADEVGPLARRLARQSYQRHFAIALALAASFHLTVMLASLGVRALVPPSIEETIPFHIDIGPTVRHPLPPPPIAPPKPPEEVLKPPAAPPEFTAPPDGKPVPVPEEQADAKTIRSDEQRRFIDPAIDTEGLGDEDPGGPLPGDGDPLGGFGPPGGERPDPGAFVVVEKQPELVVAPTPAYPELAKLARIEGVVTVRALVGRDGKVKEVILLKGAHDLLDRAALDAARSYVFTPALQNKTPVPVWVSIPFRFKLYGGD